MQHKIKTLAQAFEAEGMTADTKPDVSNLPEKYRVGVIANFNRQVLTAALNEEWVPDYSNKFQRKYELYVWVEADAARRSGFGFSYTAYYCWITLASAGSRFVFKSAELVEYAVSQFPDVFVQDMLIIK